MVTYPTATRNYLRVRGEYSPLHIGECFHKELPPRARRIRVTHVTRLTSVGTTSACAENTPGILPLSTHNRNYLRVRGEYCLSL